MQQQPQQMMQHGGMIPMEMQQQQNQPQQQQFPPGTVFVSDQQHGAPRMMRSVAQMQQMQGGRMMMQGGPGQQGHLVQMQGQQAPQLMMQGRPMMAMGGGGNPQQQPPGTPIRLTMTEMEIKVLQMMKPEAREQLLRCPEDHRKGWIQRLMRDAHMRKPNPAMMAQQQQQQQFIGGGSSDGTMVMAGQHHMTTSGSSMDPQFAAQTVVAGPGGGAVGPGYPGQQQQQFMSSQQHQYMQQRGPMMAQQGPPQQQQQMMQQHGGQQIIYRMMEPSMRAQFGGPRAVTSHGGVQMIQQQPIMQSQISTGHQNFGGQFGGAGGPVTVYGAPGGPPPGLSPNNFQSMGPGGGPGGPVSVAAAYASPSSAGMSGGVGGPMSSGPSPGSAYMQDASPGYGAMHMNMQSKMMGNVAEPSPLSGVNASGNLESQPLMGGATVGPPQMAGPHNSAAVGPGMHGSVPGAPMEDLRYQEKIREMQVYLDHLKRTLEQSQRDGSNQSSQNKLQRFIDILEGRNKVPYEILLKCEETLKKNKRMMEEGVDNKSRIFQPFLDSIANALAKNDNQTAVNLIFKRTFDFPWSNIPACKRIRPYDLHQEMEKEYNAQISPENPFRKESCDKTDQSPSTNASIVGQLQSASTEEDGAKIVSRDPVKQPIPSVPLAIQREVACLEPRFKITFDKSRDYSSSSANGCNPGSDPDEHKMICLLCDIEDQDLPLIPALKLKVPLDYPLNNPKFDLSFDAFAGASFFEQVKKQADGKFARMGQNYSITAILNNWESTIRQVCAT